VDLFPCPPLAVFLVFCGVGMRSCMQQISKANRGDISPEDLKERQAKAMADPEIQAILTDPVMRQVRALDFHHLTVVCCS